MTETSPPNRLVALKDVLFGRTPLFTLRMPHGVPLLIGAGVPIIATGLWGVFAYLGDPFIGAILAGVYFTSILLHEVGHACGAWLIGSRVREVRIDGLTGRCLVDPIQNRGRALVFFGMGPMAHVVIALPAAIALLMLSGPEAAGKGFIYPGHAALAQVLEMTVGLNLILLILNLLPIMPHDGGHMLRLGLGAALHRRRAAQVSGAVGLAIAASGPALALYLWLTQGIILPLIFPVRPSWRLLRRGTTLPPPVT